MSSCILYQNSTATIILLDIPRSIELAQGCPLQLNRLISSKPVEIPFPSLEPSSRKARANFEQVPLKDLILQRHLQLALDEVNRAYAGPWCSPRVTSSDVLSEIVTPLAKRLKLNLPEEIHDLAHPVKARIDKNNVLLKESLTHPIYYHHNPNPSFVYANFDPNNDARARIPPRSTVLQGDIAETRDTFMTLAAKFDFIILDPPWPNRSARRKQSYSTSYGTSEIRTLLRSIPVCDHLAADGLIAVWVTNKPALRDVLLEPGGLFEEWGVDLVEEWIWLKVTTNGEPICALDSMWRRPFEVLLVGRNVEMEKVRQEDVKRRVIIAVPDLHSRKPNLKFMFDNLLGKNGDEYKALEIFARNLTAGWWGWGNEVLKFQMDEHWTNI